MNRSITQSPSRYYVNNSRIDIQQQPIHKTKYFSGKKDASYNNAAPSFDEYDKLLDQEKTHKQLSMMNKELGDMRSDKQAMEAEKKQKDYEIQKLLAEKEFLMRNATQNNGKLKDIKKSNLYNVQDENDRLKRELDEQRSKELQMQTMISNQKQQIIDLEQRYKHKNTSSTTGKPKPLLTEDGDDEGANPKRFGYSQGNYGNSSSRNHTPTNSFRLRKQKYMTPSKDYSQTATNGLKIEEWQPRNFTPHEEGTERRRSLATNKNIFQDPSLNPTFLKSSDKTTKNYDSAFKETYTKIQPYDYDSVMPGFDPMIASRDEMNQYINILKKQFTIQERKYINEIENLRIKIQRLEIEKLEVIDQSKQKELQASDYENKLKDREKELSLAYIKLKNPESKLGNSSNYAVNTIPSSRSDQSKISRTQNVESLKGQLSSEDLMMIATHARLTKITIWSSSDRIQGMTFQYTKPDGGTLESENSYFFQRNYRYDTFTVHEDDQVQIIGKYNIKGVKYIQINNSKGPQKKYRPVGVQEEELDSDETFVIPVNSENNLLKIMFPNVFSYDMKGAKIYDRHHQNFIYVETNRISSLQNAEVIWNREVLDKKVTKKDPMEGKRTDSPPRSFNIPGSNSTSATGGNAPQDDDHSSSNPDYAKFYYSDQIDSYKLNEVKDSTDGGRINFSDGELIFMEKKLKIFKVFIWADENYVYGLKFSYLTPDGFNLIEGKQHCGIDMQHLSYKEVDLSNPEIFLLRVYFYRRDNMYIEKLVFLLSNGQKFSWGRQVPSREAKECLVELKQVSSYVYGSLVPLPAMQTPGQFVLSNLRVSEIR